MRLSRQGWRTSARTAVAISEREEGATLVEMGIASVIFFGVLFAIVEFSFALYTYSVVTNSAREAARYAIVRGSSLGTVCTAPGAATCIAQASDIQAYVKQMGFPGIDPSRVTVDTTWPGTVGVCSPSATPCNNPGNIVQVVVTYNFPLSIPYFSGTQLNLRSTAQMLIAR